MVLAKKDKIRIRILGTIFMSLLLIVGCSDEDKLGTNKSISAKGRPQLSTRNVFTLISDSGFTKYKVLTPLWNVYNGKGDSTYWDFPEGVYLRQLDHNLKEVSMVAADSAKYFPAKKLWALYGRVEIDQKDRAYFYSDRIFFDDRQKLIYSDTFIHIKTPTQILEGTGFESNQTLTKYRVLNPTGMFPMHMAESTGRAAAAFEAAEEGSPPAMFMPSFGPDEEEGEPGPDAEEEEEYY